jgi:predicted house-cleaning noncanonical NTP pyrophosphatase (MazG superfamily)
MANRKNADKYPSLKPLNSILFISEDGLVEIPPESINIEQVGEKAFGLSCLPKLWTLPFIVVSENLFFKYKNGTDKSKQPLINSWTGNIIKGAFSAGILENDDIIVRSSGCLEGLKERGKFYSVDGRITDFFKPLTTCLEKLATDKDVNKNKIPLVIQKLVIPTSAKGHLSNERRCYEEARDWLGQYEGPENRESNFQINLRNWRQKINTNISIDNPLKCNLSAHVSEVLKIPASWAYEKNLRIHFEWVWDGKTIFLVQADQDKKGDGVSPTKVLSSYHKKSLFTPRYLVKINDELHYKYSKIRNVFIYQKLGLPIAPIYILDDQTAINNLANKQVPEGLRKDIEELVKRSLVIRMDMVTDDLGKKQLFPRTEEIRNADEAVNWLIKKSADFRIDNKKDVIAFIFHNFIPAVSSAFALATPGERKVQIEALWGLPEGLYFNSHDKYIVDTITPNAEAMNIDKFTILEKRNFKHFFIAPKENGEWTTKIVIPPYDWGGSIRKKTWVKEIAKQSRRIAEAENKPLSIMWFIDIKRKKYESKIFPWYHECYNAKMLNRGLKYRTKTPYDKRLVIRTEEDLNELRSEGLKPHSDVRQVRIELIDKGLSLLRNKNILRDIGDLTNKIGAVILLEGGVLSHPYYQLLQTKAVVEVKHPFSDFEDKREFNKLVRDKIPQNIEDGGEIVHQTNLTGESLSRVLREKLVEEAFEVLDSVDQNSIIGELADVNEVIDGILSHIGVSREELHQYQIKKREKAGGFKKGTILLETRNPPPSSSNIEDETSITLFDDLNIKKIGEKPKIDDRLLIALSHEIEKWIDKKKHYSATETIMRIVVPTVCDNWYVNAPDNIIYSDPESGIEARLSGKRIGSKYQIELSFFSHERQLNLFDNNETEKQ